MIPLALGFQFLTTEKIDVFRILFEEWVSIAPNKIRTKIDSEWSIYHYRLLPAKIEYIALRKNVSSSSPCIQSGSRYAMPQQQPWRSTPSPNKEAVKIPTIRHPSTSPIANHETPASQAARGSFVQGPESISRLARRVDDQVAALRREESGKPAVGGLLAGRAAVVRRGRVFEEDHSVRGRAVVELDEADSVAAVGGVDEVGAGAGGVRGGGGGEGGLDVWRGRTPELVKEVGWAWGLGAGLPVAVAVSVCVEVIEVTAVSVV